MYRHIGILICDDSPDDCYLLTMAFRKAGINAEFESVNSGLRAMEYLLGKGGFTERRLPSLLILDIKMPGVDGFGVLEWVRTQAGLKSLPVLMLSGSDLTADVDRAFDAGCNAYMAKPHSVERREELVRSIESFWLRQSRFPSCCGRAGSLLE